MKGNPIIFLDFDGVINTIGYYKTEKCKRVGGIDTTSISGLNEIVAATGAKIVISSTWRILNTLEKLIQLLNDAGFKGDVIGVTKDLRRGINGRYTVRGNEIFEWIESHPTETGCPYYDYKNYLILDDDSDMLYCQRNNFIHVDPFVGITPRTVFQAKKILNAKIEIKDMA